MAAAEGRGHADHVDIELRRPSVSAAVHDAAIPRFKPIRRLRPRDPAMTRSVEA
jgi:hypothetical protein